MGWRGGRRARRYPGPALALRPLTADARAGEARRAPGTTCGVTTLAKRSDSKTLAVEERRGQRARTFVR